MSPSPTEVNGRVSGIYCVPSACHSAWHLLLNKHSKGGNSTIGYYVAGKELMKRQTHCPRSKLEEEGTQTLYFSRSQKS